MNKRVLSIALVVGSIASISNLPAEENQNSSTKQPTLEDRTDRLEQGEQDLKSQIEQLRGDVTDLQDRVNRLDGGQRPAQAPPPPAAKSSETRTGSGEEQNAEAGSGPEQSFDVFYQGLQSGGHWFDDPTYGYVWQPLPPEVEDDSQIRVEGWVDNYYDIGPSAYVFVTTSDLARPTYRDVIAPSDQNVEFLAQTKNVTSIAYGKNGVTVNGPAYEQLASQTHIPQYKLHYVTQTQGRFGISTRANELQVVAPPATLQRHATMQPKVEEQLAKADLDHGWQQIDQAKATQLKQTMEKQAPVPGNLPQKPAAPKPVMGGTQSQPTQNTKERQPAGNAPTRASSPNQPRPATQQGTPQGATPAPAAGAPPRPEATPARPGSEEGPPITPRSEQNRQMQAPTPGVSNKAGEETRKPGTPSASPTRSAEPREQRQEAPPPRPSPSVESRSQPTEKSPAKEQRENQGSNEPAREQRNEAPKQSEPGERPSANNQENMTRQRKENRREEPGSKTEQPAEPKQQPEAGRAIEKNQSEERNSELNKNQGRAGTGEEQPKKEESPSKQRGNQREKQGAE